MRAIDADALEPDADYYDGDYWAVSIVQIHNAPTIEPRKKGKWLPDNNSLYEMRFVCSECHESEVVPTIGFTKYKPIWDFCPNCGADMRKGEGEKE